MNQPYLLIPIIIVVLFFYSASYSLCKLKFIERFLHRKIWNTLLLITFIVTALMGFLLVVQINFKLDIPWIKDIIKWHVNFGIGMSLIGIFHLFWHWNFYQELFSSNKINQKQPIQTNRFVEKRKGFVLAVLLGISAMVVQIVMIRELMALFGGNELVIGVVMFNWMLLTGAGAWIGKKSEIIVDQTKSLIVGFLILILLPPILLFLLHISYHFIYAPRVAINILSITIHSLMVLFPFCLVSGFLFTFLSHLASLEKNETEKVYLFENIGSIAGGLIFSFILVYFFSAFEVFAILVFLLIPVVTFLFNMKGGKMIIPILFALIIPLVIFIFNPDRYVQQMYFGQEEIVFALETTQGKLAITSRDGQVNLYENNVLIYSEFNSIAKEEAIHYAMCNHPSPENILLISGGIAGLIEEIEKYPVQRIDYIEPIEEIFEIESYLKKEANTNSPSRGGKGEDSSPLFLSPKGEIIHDGVQKKKTTYPFQRDSIFTHATDSRLFLQKTDKKYDVAIINISGPFNAMLCRYYNLEFFEQIKQKMANGGIIATSLNGTVNYAGDLDIKLNSILYNTLKQIFKNVEIIPSERNYFIASDSPIRLDIAQLIKEKNIQTEYVNEYFLDDGLLKERSRELEAQLKIDEGVSSDLFPKAYLLQIQLFQSLFGSKISGYWSMILLLFFPLFFLLRKSSINIGIFAAGFASASAEFILLLIFQSLYGYVYQALGILVSCFMIGLALAAWLRTNIITKPTSKHFSLLLLGAIVILLLMIIFFSQSKHLGTIPFITWVIIILFMTAEGWITGMIFAVAVNLKKGKVATVASTTYAADIWGAALGALITSVVFIPTVGVINAIWIIIGLVGISLILKNKTK